MRNEIQKIIDERIGSAIKLTNIDVSKFGVEVPPDIKGYLKMMGVIDISRINNIKGNYRGLKNWLINTFLETLYLEQEGKLYPFKVTKNGKTKYSIYENGQLRYLLTDNVAERRTYGISGKLVFIRNDFGMTFHRNETNKTIIFRDYSHNKDIIFFDKFGQKTGILKKGKKINMRYNSKGSMVYKNDNGSITEWSYKYEGDFITKKTLKFNEHKKLVGKSTQVSRDGLVVSYTDELNPGNSFTQNYNCSPEQFSIIRNEEEVFTI